MYLRLVRPVVIAGALLASIATWIWQPGLLATTDLAVIAFASIVACVTWALSYRLDPVRIALVLQPYDAALILVVVAYGSDPEQAAQFLLMPIISLAYFGSVRATIITTVATAVVVQVASNTVNGWNDDKLVSPIALLILICGSLVAFITSRARHAERELELDVARDRVALRLARSVRMADDPSEAIEEIARTVGGATGSQQAVVALLEHDDDYVADIASWHAEGSTIPDDIDITSIDATLRHLVASGHGAILTSTGTRLIAPVDSDELLAPGNAAVDASMRTLLARLGAGSGVVAALPVGGRAVGAIVLTCSGDHDWEAEAVPLLDTIAPQLAAGLAQVVLVRDQRDALESLERVDRMRDRLIANVSHELRTPLTSTIGFIETLLRDDLDVPQHDRQMLMEHARDGGLRLLALVEDLLALGSTRPESLDLVPEPVQLSQLVIDAMRGIEAPAGRHLALQVDKDPHVTVDRNRMLQVFANLVVNAVHHGDGDIVVRCHATDGSALVDVIDGGPGVAPEHVHELFLPFARFSTRSDSTGLGLAICRTIVEAHGGLIAYDRIPVRRTRFRVRIPAGSRMVP